MCPCEKAGGCTAGTAIFSHPLPAKYRKMLEIVPVVCYTFLRFISVRG